MNNHEALLAVTLYVRDCLLSFFEEEPDADEIESMGDVADTLMEGLDFTVTGESDGIISATVRLVYED